MRYIYGHGGQLKRFIVLFLFVSASLPSLHASAAPAYIIILRHGEKISDKSPSLSPQGYRRANALASQFSSPLFEKRYGRPAALYAASARKNRSRRSIETLEPTGAALNLKVDDTFEKGQERELIESIRKDESLDGKTVIISWSHGDIPDFLKEFDIAGPKKKKWDNDVFNRFWILRNLPKGKWEFRAADQGVLPGDRGYCSEKLQGRARNPRRPTNKI